MVIKKMNRKEVEEALPLVWRVFTEYEAVNYSDLFLLSSQLQ